MTDKCVDAIFFDMCIFIYVIFILVKEEISKESFSLFINISKYKA